MAGDLGTAPVLSTPDTHILTEITPATFQVTSNRPSDEELTVRYEISRTISEIKKNRWERVALQFPDDMLPNSARIFQLLARGLAPVHSSREIPLETAGPPDRKDNSVAEGRESVPTMDDRPVKLTILADTSYGSRCVDEIAAEHVDADAVIHYGRACLSPTARLPVVHIFTKLDLDHASVIECFQRTFPEQSTKVIVTADVIFAKHVNDLCNMLARVGYTDIFGANVVHDPSSVVPNRSVPPSVAADRESLKQWQLFHISQPPTSLLLTLSSRMAAVHIYPTDTSSKNYTTNSLVASTSSILRRRYGLVTSLATEHIWGILINTLSVKNYLHMVNHVRQQIAKAGKKSYLFVVGKLNAAKIANFSEVGGWVVIGCWESSLIDSKDFYKPVITPYELDLALTKDEDRVWTGQWRGDFQGVLDEAANNALNTSTDREGVSDDQHPDTNGGANSAHNSDSDEESLPPEFDLRTGRYVSHTRPMKAQQSSINSRNGAQYLKALTRRAKGDLMMVNGVTSPAAEYLRAKRTWQGLGSDYEVAYETEGAEDSTAVQEGRTGIARGYTVAESSRT